MYYSVISAVADRENEKSGGVYRSCEKFVKCAPEESIGLLKKTTLTDEIPIYFLQL